MKNDDDEMVEGLFRMGNAGGGHAGDFLYKKLFKQLRVNALGTECPRTRGIPSLSDRVTNRVGNFHFHWFKPKEVLNICPCLLKSM